MKRRLALLGLVSSGVLMCASNTAAHAQSPAQMADPVVRPGYEPPRTAEGRPDLSGVWTNASTTPLQRPSEYGDQLVLSDEEVAEIEGATFERNARQNAPTPAELHNNWTEIGLQPDTLDECRSGSRGAACGYNAFWTDPGDLVMRVNGEGRTSHITYPADGRMPERVPESERGRAAIVETSEASRVRGRADNPEDRSLGERCIMSFGVSSGPVMTDQLYNNSYQFVQTKDHFAIWVEMVHDVRIVRMNDEHRTDGVRPWMGDSIGWWEGDSLVVETQGFHPQQNVRGGGPNMVVTERFTRVAPDRVHYAFHVEDLETWVEPWGGEYEFAAMDGPVYEYACHEGNYGMVGILAGARAEERTNAAETE